MKRYLVLVLALLVFLVGCADRLVRQGDDFLEKQRFNEAASYYEAALKTNPDDSELHQKFAYAKDQAVRTHITRARTAVDENRWEDAVESTRIALRWGSDRADATNWARTFDKSVSQEIYRLTVENKFPTALALGDLALDTLPPEYATQTQTERDNSEATWRGWLLGAAKDAKAAGQKATEALYLVEAARVTGDPDVRRRAVTAIEGVRANHRFTFSVFPGTSRGSAVLQHLPDTIGAATVVRGRLADASFTMEVQLRDLDVQTSTSQDQYSKEYVAGYNEYPNPKYTEIEREVKRLKREYDQAEVNANDAYRVHQLNPTDQTYAVYQSYYERQQQARKRLRDAEYQMQTTDATLKEEVRQTHTWTVHHATRVGVANVYMRWVDPISGKTATAVEPVRITQSDSGQDGYQPAGVAFDPLEIDSVETFEAALAMEASKHVNNMLRQSYESHMSESLQRAEQAHGATEAAALGVILNPADPPAGSLEKASRLTGVQKAVVKHIEP